MSLTNSVTNPILDYFISHSPKMGTITKMSCRLHKYMNFYSNLIEMAYKIHFVA